MLPELYLEHDHDHDHDFFVDKHLFLECPSEKV